MAAERSGLERTVVPGGEQVPLDAVDLAVLEELLRDARASQRSIARAVGMSPPAVGERIARLERAGVITGYRAVIDRERLGFPVTAYLSLEVFETGPHPVQVIRALADLPEVEDVSIVTGPHDLMLRVRVRNHEHLRRTLRGIWAMEGVRRTETFLSLERGEAGDIDRELLRQLRNELEGSHPTP